MKDVVMLEIGDTTIPFGEYEGDTAAYCRGIQDAFRYLGVDSDVSQSILSRMTGKSMAVQKMFLLRLAGFKQKDIAERVGMCQQTVSKYIGQKCDDVREILRDYVKPVVDVETYTIPDKWSGDRWRN
jgi:predicted XRE-type DNA-binding protein